MVFFFEVKKMSKGREEEREEEKERKAAKLVCVRRHNYAKDTCQRVGPGINRNPR